MQVKQADFSGCMDDESEAPTVTRWKSLLAKMNNEGAPLTLKQLAVSGRDLLECVPAPMISQILQRLLYHAACFPEDNTKEKLLSLVRAYTR